MVVWKDEKVYSGPKKLRQTSECFGLVFCLVIIRHDCFSLFIPLKRLGKVLKRGCVVQYVVLIMTF